MTDRQILRILQRDAGKIARELKILHRFKVVLAGDKNYGWTVPLENGYLIGVRVSRMKGGRMSWRTIFDTLCHEISHMAWEWIPNHGKDFEIAYKKIKGWARKNMKWK